MKKEPIVIVGVCFAVAAGLATYRHHWMNDRPMPIARVEQRSPEARPLEPTAKRDPKPSTVFNNGAMLERAKTDPHDRIRELANAVQNEQSNYDQIASAYDETHRAYSERVAEHAAQSELATYQLHLNELIQELRSNSMAISKATTELTDAYVAQRLVSLGIEASPKRTR